MFTLNIHTLKRPNSQDKVSQVYMIFSVNLEVLNQGKLPRLKCGTNILYPRTLCAPLFTIKYSKVME